jgi:hypothetical protein
LLGLKELKEKKIKHKKKLKEKDPNNTSQNVNIAAFVVKAIIFEGAIGRFITFGLINFSVFPDKKSGFISFDCEFVDMAANVIGLADDCRGLVETVDILTMDLFIVGVCNTVVEADEILTSELLTFEKLIKPKVMNRPIAPSNMIALTTNVTVTHTNLAPVTTHTHVSSTTQFSLSNSTGLLIGRLSFLICSAGLAIIGATFITLLVLASLFLKPTIKSIWNVWKLLQSITLPHITCSSGFPWFKHSKAAK